MKEQVDQILFGKEKIPTIDRIEKGLNQVVSTHIMLLTLFVLMFTFIFRNQGPLDKLIEADMVEDPLSSGDPLV